jgi:hypothetical protein
MIMMLSCSRIRGTAAAAAVGSDPYRVRLFVVTRPSVNLHVRFVFKYVEFPSNSHVSHVIIGVDFTVIPSKDSVMDVLVDILNSIDGTLNVHRTKSVFIVT